MHELLIPEAVREMTVEQLIAVLTRQSGLKPEIFEGIGRERLIEMVDFAPDIRGVSVCQRWMYKDRPRARWKQLLWFMIGTPMTWRFEVAVDASWSWQYAVCDTLDQARAAAQEAYSRFGYPE